MHAIVRTVGIALTMGLVVGCTESDAPESEGNGSQASASGRDQVRVVGSSTVYPFSSYVAEEFGATTEHPTPVVESTGSGGGIKLFCAGPGLNTPDITNASRRMEPGEFEDCRENGVGEIVEGAIGYDGIAVAEASSEEQLNLTLEQMLLAVAAEVPQDGQLVQNPYTRWNEIDPALPDREILIYGPPTTSGTRDSFEELVMEAASEDMEAYGGPYTRIRQDGVFVPSGENDNLIVQRIEQNQAAIGVFGYSFLEENPNQIQAITIGGVEPTPQVISSGEYPIARSMFFYAKNAHFDQVSSMAGYVELFMSEGMIAPDGRLADLGLIALSEQEREQARQRVADRVTLERSDLEDH
ncbi:MAG: substrate-binding domain-containing protein [Halofilum sp. (in: g-proteobacteria)]